MFAFIGEIASNMKGSNLKEISFFSVMNSTFKALFLTGICNILSVCLNSAAEAAPLTFKNSQPTEVVLVESVIPHLSFELQVYQSLIKQKSTDQEAVTQSQMIDQLLAVIQKFSFTKRIQFRDSSDPIFQLKQGEPPRTAVTGPEIDTPIYFNRQALQQKANLGLAPVFELLIHELGHKITKDSQFNLDQLANEIQKQVKKKQKIVPAEGFYLISYSENTSTLAADQFAKKSNRLTLTPAQDQIELFLVSEKTATQLKSKFAEFFPGTQKNIPEYASKIGLDLSIEFTSFAEGYKLVLPVIREISLKPVPKYDSILGLEIQITMDHGYFPVSKFNAPELDAWADRSEFRFHFAQIKGELFLDFKQYAGVPKTNSSVRYVLNSSIFNLDKKLTGKIQFLDDKYESLILTEASPAFTVKTSYDDRPVNFQLILQPVSTDPETGIKTIHFEVDMASVPIIQKLIHDSSPFKGNYEILKFHLFLKNKVTGAIEPVTLPIEVEEN